MTEYEQIALDKIADHEHEIYALLKQRYSPRVFSEEPIGKQDMKQLFEAARWAASCNNWQPWRFIYGFKGEDGYDKIYDCLDEFNQSWADNAPVLMLTAYKEKTPDGKDNFHALHDLGLAMGNMTVQAQYKGIALHHMAGFDWKKAQEVFDVPEGYHFSTAVAIGYFGGELEKLPEDLQEQEQSERERIPQTDFAFENNWNAKV
ncbi:nitroreductase family protein [Euzebyella saccharophila]|uniref:Nitroreductase family protein n=1 Tax=Euzebyella saccharophila TaxID=679664 RepID=A0ABV8JQX0_9FLAO|nr:nitroreductase family protein [Euzebyella saccharophila]